MAAGPGLSLKGRALRLLAQREHSRAELVRKLTPHAPEPAALEQVLDDLQSKGWLDEQRVIDSVIHQRASLWGAARLKQALQSKGLEDQAIAHALASLRGSELERAQTVWQRKFGAKATDAKERARQGRFLLSRGFAPEVVHQVLK